MAHLSYLAILAGCLVCVAPLAFALRRVVRAQLARLGLSLLVTFVIFSGWDVYAIHAHHWRYAQASTLGVALPGRLPVEEALFFLVVPFCVILTFETVHRVLAGRLSAEKAMTYTALAATAVLIAVALDVVALRTKLVQTLAFWLSYCIILAFQLVVNGLLTGHRIVTYNPTAITGLRIAHAPIEDIAFGFAMTLCTLITWTRLGTRGSDTSAE